MLTSEEEQELDELLYEGELEDARKHLFDFTESTLKGFQTEPFHEKYYELLHLFAVGDIKRLMVTMPPQHGKSEGSTRRLPAYMLGINPDLKIAIASYNATFASKFNRDVQRIIDSKKYYDIFPDTTLSESNIVASSRGFLRNQNEFEVADKKGGVKSVGRGGPLTGSSIDVIIMDDLYKDFMEGNSPIIREAVWDWYTTVVKTRLHNKSQELIVFTRWHEDDLIGRLEAKGTVHTIDSIRGLDKIELEENDWIKVNFEAIKEGDKTKIDPREKGTSLWESKHSIKKLIGVKKLDNNKFDCLYQGNPLSSDGLLYGNKFKTYKELPETKITKNYTDTADTGADKLCSIVYKMPLDASDDLIYVTDILYTDEPMEKTEPLTIDLFNKNKVNQSKIESNNGGRGFARVVEKGVKTHIDWFHQGNNKEARIFSNSATVLNHIVFPSNWAIKWPEFYNHVTRYKKLFKANKFDDAPDVLTGIVETEKGDQMFFF